MASPEFHKAPGNAIPLLRPCAAGWKARLFVSRDTLLKFDGEVTESLPNQIDVSMNNLSTQADAGGVAVTHSGGRAFRVLRIWPAVLLAGLTLATRFGPALIEGGLSRYWMVAVFGPLLCCLLLLVW